MSMHSKLVSLALLSGLASFAQAPSVTSVTFDGVSHSVARLSIRASANFYFIRTRFIPSPGTCTAGTGGIVQGSYYSTSNFAALQDPGGSKIVIAGLLPGTTYQVCPEISTDGNNWSSGFGATLTTTAAPVQHPARPIVPAVFNTDYPDTTGYHVVNIAPDCSDLSNQISSAIQNQGSFGTILQLAPGQVCTGTYNIYQRASDTTLFPSSAVNTTANSINVNGHGLNEGQGIIFGTSYGCLPTSLTNLNGGDCHHNGAIIAGQLYWVHVVDTNNFQIYSGSAASSGGTLVALPDAGNGTMMYVRWPRPLNWIILRTATPDNLFTPEHVRVNPSWAPAMAVIQAPGAAMNGAITANTLMHVGDSDGNDMSMLANIRFVGIEFTYQLNPAAFTSSDPLPWYTMFATPSTDQNIIIDRCWFHGLGTPNRVYNAISWDGMNVAIIDSYLDNFEYFHSVYSGLGLTKVN